MKLRIRALMSAGLLAALVGTFGHLDVVHADPGDHDQHCRSLPPDGSRHAPGGHRADADQTGGCGAGQDGQSGEAGNRGGDHSDNPALCPPRKPCTMFGAMVPGNAVFSDPGAQVPGLELGVRFHADVDGMVRGIRFYDGMVDQTTHTGSLWSTSGSLLATATFAPETANGWQEVAFGTPVAVSAGTTYVASYHTVSGHYSYEHNFFSTRSWDAPPLHGDHSQSADSTPACTSGPCNPNGPFVYGPGQTFPRDSFKDSNYWVDVLFTIHQRGEDG